MTFEEIDVESAPEKRAEMQTRSGRRTVPQIFIGDHTSAAATTCTPSRTRASSTPC